MMSFISFISSEPENYEGEKQAHPTWFFQLILPLVQ